MEWPNNKSPEEIIGLEYMGLFELHFSAIKRCNSVEETERVVKNLGLSPEEIRLLSEKYKELRENGIYPDGIDARGNVTWAISKPGPIGQLMKQKELEEKENAGKNTVGP